MNEPQDEAKGEACDDLHVSFNRGVRLNVLLYEGAIAVAIVHQALRE
jgi:hypothetical protein